MQPTSWFSSAAYRTAMLTCAIFFVCGLTVAAIGPSLPVLATRLSVDVAALGGLFTSFSVGVIAAQAGVVGASRRFGQRGTLAASMLLMAAGSITIAQGGSLLALFAAALVGGAGFGGVLATGNTLIAQLFPARSAAALNGINLFFGIGSIVGPSLAAVTDTRLGMPQLVLWIGALGLAVLFPLVLSAVAARASAAKPGAAVAQAESSERVWLLGVLLLVYIGTEIGFGAWLTLYMVISAGMDVASAALVVSSFWLALTSGRALAAVFGARISTWSLLRLCLAGLLLGAVLLAFGIGNVGLTLAGVLIFGLSCGPVFPTVLALVASSAGGGAATSRALALGNAGGLLVPALIGLLLTRAGAPAVVGLLIVATLLMIGLGTAALRPAGAARVGSEADCTSVG
jgi:MFS transporter, FHS family, L-fucose permease